MTPEISIVISFIGFVWIFVKKVYPFVINTIDDHILSVKNKIQEAELLKKNASLALENMYAKKNDMDRIMRENQAASDKRIKQLNQENKEYLKALYLKFEISLKNQLEFELAKHKDLLIEKLSDQLIEKLAERIDSSDHEILIDVKKEDLKKLA